MKNDNHNGKAAETDEYGEACETNSGAEVA